MSLSLPPADQAGPFLLFFAAFIEYIFPPFPGDALVVAGAWYATHGGLPWPIAFLATTAGSLAGAAVDWRIGIWLAGRIDRGLGAGRFDIDALRRFQASYRRWGAVLLVVNRFLPAVRAIFFVAAGASRISLAKVLLFGGLSAAAWNALLLGAGAAVARNEKELLALFWEYQRYSWAALVAVALAALIVWLIRRRKRA